MAAQPGFHRPAVRSQKWNYPMAALPGQGHLSWLQPLAGDGSGEGRNVAAGSGGRSVSVAGAGHALQAVPAGVQAFPSEFLGKQEGSFTWTCLPAGCCCVSSSTEGRVALLGKLVLFLHREHLRNSRILTSLPKL